MVNKNTLEQLIDALNITSAPESWKTNWDAAVTAFTSAFPDGELPFLQSDYIQSAGEFAYIPAARIAHIQQTAELIRKDTHLKSLCWLWHYILFLEPDYEVEQISSWPLIGSWPLPIRAESQLADWFPVVVLLSGCTRLKQKYADRNIPDSVIEETLWDVNNCLSLFEMRNGKLGMALNQLSWLMHHFNGELYRLGRLQFGIQKFVNRLHGFRNLNDGRLLALSAPGLKYRSDGLIDGTNDIYDADNSWTSELIDSDEAVTGNPLSSDGYASRQPITLLKAEWQIILSPGDYILDCHIPTLGRLTSDLYNDSYSRAIGFFDTYFPEKSFKAYKCSSWLLEPQLRTLLPESSNIVQFQKDYYLYPMGGGDWGFFYFLFKCEPCPLDQLPEKTSLQKTIKDFMLSGGKLHSPGGFIPIER